MSGMAKQTHRYITTLPPLQFLQTNNKQSIDIMLQKHEHLLWLNCPDTAKAVGFTVGPIDGCVNWAMRALWFENWRDGC